MRTRPTAGTPAPTDRDALRRLLAIENARDASSPFLKKALASSSPRVARQAALVMGRIGEANFEPLLISALSRPEAGVRRTAAFSLGLLSTDGEKTRAAILDTLSRETDADVRHALWQTFGRKAARAQFSTLADAIATELQTKAPTMALVGAIEGLMALWNRERTDWGPQPRVFELLTAIARRDDLAAEAASVALARFRGDRVPEQIPVLLSILRSSDNEIVQGFVLRSIGGVRASAAVDAIEEILAGKAPLALRVEAALALGRQDWSGKGEILFGRLLTDRNPRVVVQALEAIRTPAEAAASLAPRVEAVMRDASRTAQERKNALLSLAAVAPARALAIARPWVDEVSASADQGLGLGGKSVVEKALVLAALDVYGRLAPQLAPHEDITDILASLMLSNDTTLAASAAEALAQVPAEALAKNSALGSFLAQALKARDFRLTCHVADVVKASPRVEIAGDLLVAWEFYREPSQNDGRLCLLEAMAAVAPLEGSPKAALLERVKSALADPVASVAARAAEIVGSLTGAPVDSAVTRHNKAQTPTPSLAEVQQALGARLVFITSHGEIHMKMLSAAPLTATNVVRLAKEGFYDGLSFHRVVPNFVVQGGDPRGDGWGGPGYLIRDEVSLVSHAPGTVGIATSGKDTGGSQFFINETHNFHLNGTYTVFARVTKGMDVVRRLTEGDVIQSVGVQTAP